MYIHIAIKICTCTTPEQRIPKWVERGTYTKLNVFQNLLFALKAGLFVFLPTAIIIFHLI